MTEQKLSLAKSFKQVPVRQLKSTFGDFKMTP